MECELLLLQPRLLPAWLARFWTKQGERGISREPRGPHEPPSFRGLREMLRLPRLAHN